MPTVFVRGNAGGGDEVSVGSLLLLAYPDRVAKARGADGHFVLANGRGAFLDAGDRLARSHFLVVADLQGRAQNARIAAAAQVSEDEIRALLAARIERGGSVQFDAERQIVRVSERERLGAIVLSERQLPAPKGEASDRAILQAARELGPSILPWDRGSETLRSRLGWLHRGLGEPWPDVSDSALVERLEDWLLPFLRGEPNLSRPGALSPARWADVAGPLRSASFPRYSRTHTFRCPFRSRLPIRYDSEGAVLAVRVQELFGLGTHPSIAGGTVPLTLELLSPAHRPVQTTRDLPRFWSGSWADVRADMRGRYPKHHWPENPLEAQATNRAKPRKVR